MIFIYNFNFGYIEFRLFHFQLALWVMWGLLCGHLVAFKAPKSWPNKFLINVWGGFSVIFVASYTANIAALIAGLFFHNAASSYDASVSREIFIIHDSLDIFFIIRNFHISPFFSYFFVFLFSI